MFARLHRFRAPARRLQSDTPSLTKEPDVKSEDNGISAISMCQLELVTGGQDSYSRPGSIFEQDGKGGVSWSDRNWRLNTRPGGDVQPQPYKIYNTTGGKQHALV